MIVTGLEGAGVEGHARAFGVVPAGGGGTGGVLTGGCRWLLGAVSSESKEEGVPLAGWAAEEEGGRAGCGASSKVTLGVMMIGASTDGSRRCRRRRCKGGRVLARRVEGAGERDMEGWSREEIGEVGGRDGKGGRSGKRCSV